jgi:hypothetical protein
MCLLLLECFELFHVRQILRTTARALVRNKIFQGNYGYLQALDRNLFLVSIRLLEVNTTDTCDYVNSTRAVANLKYDSFRTRNQLPTRRKVERRNGAAPVSGWKRCPVRHARKHPCLSWPSDSREQPLRKRYKKKSNLFL